MKGLLLILSLVFLAACGDDNSCGHIAGNYSVNDDSFDHDYTITSSCEIVDNYCESTTKIRHLGNDKYEYHRLSTNENPTCRNLGTYYGFLSVSYAGGETYLDYNVEGFGTQVLILLR